MFCRVTRVSFVTVDKPIPLLSNARTTWVIKGIRGWEGNSVSEWFV